VLVFLGTTVLLGFVWLGILRRQVRERTQLVQRHEAILEERYRDLFENANDIIYSHDLAGNLTSFNRAGEQILGYRPSEALGMNIAKVVAPVHMDFIKQKLEEKLAGAPRTSYELEVIGKDGRHRFLEINSRLIYQDARTVGVQGIARDISGRMESEGELRQREQQLQKSLEERERLGQDLHDGIIQSIYTVGLNLEDCLRVLDEEPQRAKERLASGLADLNTVIRDVRNFIVGLEPEILKGRELKTALKSLVLTLNEGGSARFILKIDPLAADALDSQAATQLLHIAREAMSNSLKHSQAGTAMISLQENSGSIRLEISDDGIGFDSKATKSSGRGLQNVFARAQTLQAELKIISQPGAGTRVVLDIPRKEAHGSVRI
jgi:PAS domain S-box-containing protein